MYMSARALHSCCYSFFILWSTAFSFQLFPLPLHLLPGTHLVYETFVADDLRKSIYYKSSHLYVHYTLYVSLCLQYLVHYTTSMPFGCETRTLLFALVFPNCRFCRYWHLLHLDSVKSSFCFTRMSALSALLLCKYSVHIVHVRTFV